LSDRLSLSLTCTDSEKCRLFSVKSGGSMQLSLDGAHAETRFLLSAKQTIPFVSAGATFQSSTGNRDVRVSC
jgi:hypothetical protein